MNSTASPSTRLLPTAGERVVFTNILLLLALPLLAQLAHLLATAAHEEVNLPVEGLLAVLAYGVASFGLLRVWRRAVQNPGCCARLQRAGARANRLAAAVGHFARTRPLAAVWLAASLGVLVSGYPVVFGGGSFVSPNYLGQLRYDLRHLLPDSTSYNIVDTQGSDVCATLAQNLPYSVIEHRAIVRDGELPVWNRYNTGGATLLGQGQSMLGDPLNLLVVLADGRAWAWDLKFLLARLLFAAGIGLCVRALTERLAGALLLAFSACFLGFFQFRLNHAATFSLGYAPWVLLPWLRLARPGGGSEEGRRGKLRWAGLWLLACWMELSSGTVKEATMLLVGLNGAGALVLLLDASHSWRAKGRVLAGMAWAGVGFLLVSAPLWRTLLDALGHSWNDYQQPRAYQLQPGMLLGLFDDIFYRQFNHGEKLLDPAANFVVLLGVAFALASFRTLARRNRAFLALSLSTLPPLALVFGVIPPGWICAVPFLGNVTHVDNVFSCVLLVLLPVLAGVGFEWARERLDSADFAWDFAAVAAVPAGLLAVYLGMTQAVQRADYSPLAAVGDRLPLSTFFLWYVATLLLAFLAVPWLLRWWCRAGQAATWGVAPWVALCFAAMLWRGGLQALGIGSSRYVMHAGPRSDLRLRSPSLEQLWARTEQEPGRCLGLDGALMPGFTAALGLEAPSGPDALQNPYYHGLLEVAHTPFANHWKLDTSSELVASPLRRFYDLLGVRYYVGGIDSAPSSQPAIDGLRALGRHDLDLYESTTAWPRAFFTDEVTPSHGAEDLFRAALLGDGRPFAAVAPGELAARPDLHAFAPLLRGEGGAADRRVVPATAYRLTSRTTTFRLQAPGPGVAVLLEGYQRPYNEQVYLDGQPVPHLRMNEAFTGIRVPAAGEHVVRVVYGPRDLPVLLGISALGLLLLGGTAVWHYRRDGVHRADREVGWSLPPLTTAPDEPVLAHSGAVS